MNEEFEDHLTFIENGQEIQYRVDTYFEMDGKRYVLLSSGDKTNIKSVEGNEDDHYFTEIPDNEVGKILNAYQTSLKSELS